jgi:hypothetical protein
LHVHPDGYKQELKLHKIDIDCLLENRIACKTRAFVTDNELIKIYDEY